MSRCTFNTEDSLNRLFTEDWVSETVSNVRELLIISPFLLVFSSFVVIVMSGGGAVVKGLLVVDFLGLGEPGTCWLSPSVVVLKELVLQVIIVFLGVINLVESLWDV